MSEYEREKLNSLGEGYRYNEKGELEWQEWTDEVSLTLIGFNGFTYHRPATREEVQKYAVLGDIDIISAEKRSDIKIKFKEAVN
ncbi:MAG: hypothetical protein H0Z40_11830 [Desulfotomaculum sp.]|nr:hypothetical protein [Desulfotomaculum sp.]